MTTTPPVLRGPADADSYRVKQGRFGTRFYTDPLPSCPIADASDWVGPSISATKPPFANKYVPMKAIAEMADTEWVRLSKLTVDDRYEAIKVHDKNTSRVNMARGSLGHEWAEDALYGRQMRMPIGYDTKVIEQAELFKPALQAFFDTYQPELVAAEVVCLHRTLNDVGYGGTADAFARINGEIWVIDWKTRNSDHAAYLEEAAQGGGYAGAEYMIVTGPDGNPARSHIPDVAGVLIVSIRTDGFKAYPIDRDGAIKVYAAMHRWWADQRSFTDEKVIGRPWAPKVSAGGTGSKSQPTREVDPPADASRVRVNKIDAPFNIPADLPPATMDAGNAPGATQITITTSNGHQPPVSVTYTRDQIRARIGELIAAGHEPLLRTAWPADVAPLSKPGQTAAQLEAVLNAVKRVEADTATAFHPDDTPNPPATDVEPDPTPAPAGVGLDEGGLIDAGARTLLEQDFNRLTDDQRNTIARITREAAEHGHSISVSANPTTRRWAIARALIRAAATDTDLWSSAVDIATPEQVADNEDLTLGALISTFTIEQANRLHDSLDQTVAA